MTSRPTAVHPDAGRPDTRDMMVVHDALRHAYARLPALVRAVTPGDTVRSAIVADHVSFTESLLHHHHAGEDRVLWPTLLPRLPAAMMTEVAAMEAQHRTIQDLQVVVCDEIAAWRPTAAPASRDRLAQLLEELETEVVDHLAAEESLVLPLVRQHLTVPEWERLGEEGLAGLSKSRLPLVFGLLMYTSEPERVRDMLAHAPAPLRLVLPRLAPRLRARYYRRVHGTATP